jgi:hypothetical protein
MQTATAALLQKECNCRSPTRALRIKKKMVRMGTTPETRHRTKVPLPLIPLAFATGGSSQKECHDNKEKMVRMATTPGGT